MRKVLVTGGAGFIGSHIVDALVERGLQVRVLDNLSTGRFENLEQSREKIDFIEADLTDATAVARAVTGVDCIFHQAALASVPRSVAQPLETHAACATATLTLLTAARKAGVKRVVYAGSSSAYGDQPTSTKRESDLPLPISPYAVAKLAGEQYCQAFAAMNAVETVTLRYFNVFGPRQDPNSEYSAVIPKFITTLLSGKSPVIFGDGKQSRDFTFVADVVQGNLNAAEAENVSGQRLQRCQRRARDAAGIDRASEQTAWHQAASLNTTIPAPATSAKARPISPSPASSSASNQKYDLEQGLKLSIEYYQVDRQKVGRAFRTY